MHSMFGAQFLPWSKSNLKAEIELHTKHWTIDSDLLQLTYWVWCRNDSFRAATTTGIDVARGAKGAMAYQARNQLWTPGVAKNILKGAQVFSTTSNSFKLCPTRFSRGEEKFCRGAKPHAPLWLRTCGPPQISSISCRFVLGKAMSQIKCCCSLKVRKFGTY